MSHQPTQRLLALDILRGITIAFSTTALLVM